MGVRKVKILFVVPGLHNGGTITSLKNLLCRIDKDKCQVDVYPITNSGPNYDFISQYANIIGTYIGNNNLLRSHSLKDRVKGIVFNVIKHIKKVLTCWGFDPSPVFFKRVVSSLQKNNYDEVIAFQEGQATRLCSYFENVRKVAWVHCDYSKIELEYINRDRKLNVYDTYEQIICVSEYTKNRFLSIYPSYSGKTIGIHNIISSEVILKMAKEDTEDVIFKKCSNVRIVSLGRLHPVKRFSDIPRIANDLKIKGLKFNWFVIGGDSGDANLIKNNIQKYQVENEVTLLGNINNPYPYIKNADLLVCTSISEACPNVINEAKILGTPIVCTDFGSSVEMMTDGVEGRICSFDRIVEGISELLMNNEKLGVIKNNLNHYNYSNSSIEEKLEMVTSLRFLKG